MSKTREHLLAKAKRLGVAGDLEKLKNEELANAIKDKTGKAEVIEGEVVKTEIKTIPQGAQFALMVQPSPVTLLPTAAPFNPQSPMYAVWAIGAAVWERLQTLGLGYFLGVLTGAWMLRALGVAG